MPTLKNSQNIILKRNSDERWTGSKEGTSMKYWVAHLKNGQRLEFGRQSGYVEVYQDELCYAFMTCKNGDVVGIIPNESLLWAERVEEKE